MAIDGSQKTNGRKTYGRSWGGNKKAVKPRLRQRAGEEGSESEDKRTASLISAIARCVSTFADANSFLRCLFWDIALNGLSLAVQCLSFQYNILERTIRASAARTPVSSSSIETPSPPGLADFPQLNTPKGALFHGHGIYLKGAMNVTEALFLRLSSPSLFLLSNCQLRSDHVPYPCVLQRRLAALRSRHSA
ncbi:hypothetical protein AcV7_000492 [Taiwanofungus camphoratus]|nr:hypothetical protein AcV7_000492 [Antrodia cinnamomea]